MIGDQIFIAKDSAARGDLERDNIPLAPFSLRGPTKLVIVKDL